MEQHKVEKDLVYLKSIGFDIPGIHDPNLKNGTWGAGFVGYLAWKENDFIIMRDGKYLIVHDWMKYYQYCMVNETIPKDVICFDNIEDALIYFTLMGNH